jgi:hypothetical protein
MQTSLMIRPQVDLLFDHMVKIKSITPEEARMLYGVRSFHRRMADLRDLGVNFKKERCIDNTGRQYVKYHFAGAA